MPGVPGLKPDRAGTRLALAVVGTLLLAAGANAERPADTQQLDDLNRDSQRQLHSIQQRGDPPLSASRALQQRQQQSRLQSSQRNELLRQHYRNKMRERAPAQVRHEGIARQRRFQAAQESQLRRFDRMSPESTTIRSTDRPHRVAPDPLAPLRR